MAMPFSPLCSLFLLTTIFYLNFFSRIIFSPLLPTIEQSLSLTHGQAGLFFLLLSCGYLISLLCSGFVSAKLNHKKTIAVSMVALSASLLLVALGSSLTFLRCAFFLIGLATGLYLPSAISTISALFQSHQWGKAFAVHELAPNLAFLTAPLAFSFLANHMAWQSIILFLVFCTLAAGLLYLQFGSGHDLFGDPPNFDLYVSILRQKDFHLLVLLFVMGISGTIGIFNVLPLFLVNNHSMSIQDSNFLVGLSRGATLFAALLGGWLADRFGSRQTIGAVLLLTGLTTVGIGLCSDSALTLFVFLQPVLAVCFFPAGFALLSRLSEAGSRNVVISLAVPLAFVTGGGLLPFLITEMADRNYFSEGFVLTGLFISTGIFLVHLTAR